ncbi:MAG: CRP-like cAMP-binding protein [Crocinitomix sp.]|jgi:CRP-like cAMP-binding protein
MKAKISAELLKFNPSFPQDEMDKGLSLFQEKTFEANSLILKEGEVCDYIFYAESSITKCYYFDNDGQEQTLWMKPEQKFITEYKSFVNREKSQFSLQFYEQTNVIMISRKDLLSLYSESNNWALFGISLTEQVHITLIDVFVNLLANDATKNYQYIEYMFPKFIQVAPLKDIASMLQISAVSLSRIRAGKQLKK